MRGSVHSRPSDNSHAKTCIVCGKKFSARVRTTDGKWHDYEQKKTCSLECSRKWATIRKMQNYVHKKDAPHTEPKHYTPKSHMVPVEVKCPHCKAIRIEMEKFRPAVTPQRYCKRCEWCRNVPEYI